MAEMTDTRDHPLLCLVSTAVQRTNPYNFTPGSPLPFNKFTRTKRLENFLLLNIRRLSIRYMIIILSSFLSSIIINT